MHPSSDPVDQTDRPDASAPSFHQRIKEEKRSAAIQAAMSLFLEQGYDRTSLQQVAQRAGLSTGTLFKRFPTKASLFEALVEQFWKLENACESPLPPGSPRASLTKIGSDYVHRMRRPEMVSIYRLIIAEAPRFPHLGRTLYDLGKGPYLANLESYLRSEVKTGTFKISDVQRASREFLAVIAGQAFWPELVVPGCGGTNEEAAKVVERAVEIIFSVYCTDQQKSDGSAFDSTPANKEKRKSRINKPTGRKSK